MTQDYVVLGLFLVHDRLTEMNDLAVAYSH